MMMVVVVVVVVVGGWLVGWLVVVVGWVGGYVGGWMVRWMGGVTLQMQLMGLRERGRGGGEGRGCCEEAGLGGRTSGKLGKREFKGLSTVRGGGERDGRGICVP